VVYALQRFAQLVGEVAGGTCSEVVDHSFSDFAPFEVEFSFARAWRLIGQELPRDEVEAILDRLSIVRQATDDPDRLRLFVPRYRADVRRFEDVVEDILRVYGYNRIDPSPRLNAAPEATTDDSRYAYDERTADYLAANGFFEIRTNSLVAARYRSERSVNMLNPLSEENAVLRETMLLTGLEVIAHNLNRQQPDLRLFDMGKVYFSFQKEEQINYAETQRLAIYMTGRRQPDWWGGATEPVDFFDLKGAVKGVARLLGLEISESDRLDDPELAWGQTYRLAKREVGRAGLVAPRWLKEAGIKQDVYFAELDWEALRAAAQQRRIQFAELPRFPAVRRDVSLLVGGTTTFAQLAEAIHRCSPKLIRAVDLFDVYQPKGETRTSYALSIVLQDTEQTLTDERIQQVMDKVFAALRQNPDVELRV
jgi:phenylalanyl-tRNA synthetase beta chain